MNTIIIVNNQIKIVSICQSKTSDHSCSLRSSLDDLNVKNVYMLK